MYFSSATTPGITRSDRKVNTENSAIQSALSSLDELLTTNTVNLFVTSLNILRLPVIDSREEIKDTQVYLLREKVWCFDYFRINFRTDHSRQLRYDVSQPSPTLKYIVTSNARALAPTLNKLLFKPSTKLLPQQNYNLPHLAMASGPIFAAADAAMLTARNLIQPATRRRRQISSSLMFSEASSSSENSADSGVDLSVSFVIPEYIESAEALEYIGWGEEKASSIWTRWEIVKQIQSDEATLEYDFLEYALTAIPYLKLGDRQEDWDTEMLNWGVGAELRAAIMDEEYTNIRLTESAQYWVQDTMEIRYLSLERLQRDSQMRAQTLATSTNNAADTTDNIAVRAQLTTSPAVPGGLSLYKAVAKDRLKQDLSGKIAIERLSSVTPSDLRGAGGTTLYFTPTLEVAEHYRGYIKRRDNGAAPVIVKLSVPNSVIEALPPYILRFGDLWKEIVYTSRRGFSLKGDLKRIHRLPLIIAPIARSHNKSINSLDNCHQISSVRHVLYIRGSEAIQYAFQGDDMVDSLEEYGEVRLLSETAVSTS